MDYRKKFIVRPGAKVHLAKIDPSYTGQHETHAKAVPEIEKHRERMDKLQYSSTRMVSNPCWSCCRHSTPLARTVLSGMCSAG
jgi:hypothetical protein